MWRILVLGLYVSLGWVAVGSGAPLEGPSGATKRVPQGRPGEGGKFEPGTLEFSKDFAAGQRACVIAVGDHKPVVDVEIQVYDSKQNLIAQDKGQEPAKDFAAVIWYPPTQENYRIVVLSYGKEYNEVYIAIK
jgi:hypothetical protein